MSSGFSINNNLTLSRDVTHTQRQSQALSEMTELVNNIAQNDDLQG